MDWTDILKQLFEIVIFPLLGVATIYVTYLVKLKINEVKQKLDSDIATKYFNMLDKTVCEAVLAMNQTYVEALKKEGKFDAEAQKTAFTAVYNQVISILSKDAKAYLENAVDDLTALINNKIETQIKLNKLV